MKVAIVHDYLNQMGGAERVVGELHAIFPDAPIYTTIVDRNALWPNLRGANIRPSWMQRLPFKRAHFKKYLLLYRFAIESFDLDEFDLVISNSSAFAKGARVRPGARHVCYCQSPMRFVWEYDRYMERERFGRLARTALPAAIASLRRWDVRTIDRPQVYFANCLNGQRRIRDWYGRESFIVHPPVDIDQFTPRAELGDYYLVVSRLVPYKRIDLVVRTFTALGRPLIVVGDGPDRVALERMAGPTVRFLGRRPDDVVAELYARCRGFVLPGEEDFGITPLEANAAGRPVVAFAAGGALETVIDGKTGVLFREQTVEALHDAVLRCDASAWDGVALRAHATRFGPRAFKEHFLEALSAAGVRVA